MVKIKFLAVAILLSFLCGFLGFSSCVSGAKSRERLHAYLTDTSRYVLLPTTDIGKSIDMPQSISASFGGQDLFLVAWVKADETVLEMTLLNEMGTNIGELSYSDETLSFSSAVFPASVRPEYIVADFQLCFYNTVSIARALKDCGMNMEISGITRRIFKGNDLIYEITNNSEAVRLTNHLRGYTYTLEGDFS